MRVRDNYIPGDPNEILDLGFYYVTTLRKSDGKYIYPTNKDNPPHYLVNLHSVRPDQEENTCEDELHAGPPYLDGGDFLLQKQHYWSPWFTGKKSCDAEYETATAIKNFHSEATYYCQYNPQAGYDAPLYDAGDDIYQYNAQAWQRLKPVRPSAGLGVFLGELRDIPKMLQTTHRSFLDLYRRQYSRRGWPRRAGGDWLNANFGWLPFLSDLRRFYQTYANLRAMLNRIEANAGKWVRRRCVVDEDESSEDLLNSYSVNCLLPIPGYTALFAKYSDPLMPYYRTQVRRIDTKRVWATGKFRYYLPDMPTMWWRKKAVIYLFGAWPNPSLLYDLTPYTWLIDWFTNLGDIVAALDNELVEDLAMREGYLMRTESRKYEITGTHYYVSGPLSQTFTLETSYKERRKSKSYFGFSFSTDEFDPWKASILGALGLSRLWHP